MKRIPIYISILLLTAAGVVADVAGQQRQPQMSPERAFGEFEQKLHALRDYQMTFSIATEGAIESSIEGIVRVRGGVVVDLNADGMYGRQRVNLRLHSDGTRLTGGTRVESFERTVSEDFYKYFVEGLTRFGLTHTIMQLISAEPPLYPETEEEEAEWAEVIYVSAGDRRFIGNVEAFAFGIRFGSFGEQLGEGRLWINVTSGLPFRREGSLRLDEVTVNVIEHYGFSR